LRGPSPLLRLQSDERLIALTRRGQHAAFEALCARYQSRLLAFCRHMLSSREDAEDVLQEVFAAAFNAVLADEREINVRPWLYRIARNRSLNHLRRASAIGVDSMDVHFADHGLSTGDRVLRRESFRELLGDVQQLPETQRTALLLREIDALSYEQIAQAMETTVPSVKSLLVRARISLAEAAVARKLSCDEVLLELGEVAEGLAKLSAPARRHVRECDRCRFFKKQLKDNNHALAAMLPVGPVLLLKKLVLTKLGSTASASSAHMAGGAGATMGAGTAAGAGAAGGGGAAGGIFTVGAGAIATKAAAGLAAAVIVSAGAVAANETTHHRRHAVTPVATHVPATSQASEPVIVSERQQPLSAGARRLSLATKPASTHAPSTHPTSTPSAAKTIPAVTAHAASLAAAVTALPAAVLPSKQPEAGASAAPLTQVTSESTQLPATATDRAQAAALVAGGVEAPPPAQAPAGETAAPVAPPSEPVASTTQPADTPPAPAGTVSQSNGTAPGGPPPAETPQPKVEAPPVAPAASEPASAAAQEPSAPSVAASSAVPATAAHIAPRPTHYQPAPALSYRPDRWLARRWRAAALFARAAASR
jgi:RNA polymerase sigma factor (sigma-70 family)